MRIVGIDTATATASVALIEDGQLVAEEVRSFHKPNGQRAIANPKANHAESILPLIEFLLEKAKVSSLAEISGFAVSIGPGSFTGLRIGLSTVKGLAYGSRIPVVGISTLLANAARVTDFDGFICSFLDARKKEVYASLFHKRGDTLNRLTEDMVAPVNRIIDTVQALEGVEPCLFVGDATRIYWRTILDLLGSRVCLCSGDSFSSLASAIARLGEVRFRCSDVDCVGTLVPRYLRPFAAELKTKTPITG